MYTLILGLLILKSLTIYEIRANIKNGMKMMCSDSMGSIQAAIKKLSQNGYVVCVEKVENGKFKKVYSITESGREYFNDWVNTPIRAGQSKNMDLTKLFFMGLSTSATRVERIEKHINELHEQHNILHILLENAKTVEVIEEYKAVANYQLVTMQYGIDFIFFETDWYAKLIEKINKGDM